MQQIKKQEKLIALRIVLLGYVQGLGVRPAISQLAQRCSLTGTISNQADGVHLFVEGCHSAIERFQSELIDALPKLARIEQLISEEVTPEKHTEFVIQKREDSHTNHAGPLSTLVPVDMGICEQCLQETKDPTSRRYQDLFISCTYCGPRYSIIREMPYERTETAMARFDMCSDCVSEYHNSDNRRFHAQTICCPTCGPKAWATDESGRQVSQNMEAIRFICRRLEAGQIVAMRGLGGYQLLADATNHATVQKLRERKQRPEKPLAVMVADLAKAQCLALIFPSERDLLLKPANPIVILQRQLNSLVSPAVYSGLNTLGIMLPGSSLHYWIAELFGKPLVVTSGNRQAEPLAVDVEQAEERLSTLADCFLHHNRPIVNALDDSVMRVVAGRPITIRLARGLAPLSLPIQSKQHAIASGGHQKNTIAISNSQQAILGPHIGDLDSLLMRDHYDFTLRHLTSLYGVQNPEYIHDLHPDYHSTRLAKQRTEDLKGVQHHHAHIVSGMIEHDLLHQKVLGIAFDGTGLGIDETIWGGEFLLSTTQGFQRVACLSPLWLAGGEVAIRNPWRIALSLLHTTFGEEKAISIAREIFPDRETSEVEAVCRVVDQKPFSNSTTSAGRLFDGVAALILAMETVCYEGQLAMLLESQVIEDELSKYSFDIKAYDRMIVLDWQPVIRQIVDDYKNGNSQAIMASRFHRGLALGICQICEHFPKYPVLLSGGCFQNRVLVEMIVEKFERMSRKVVFSENIPMNDGGLAAGQLVIGTAQRS